LKLRVAYGVYWRPMLFMIFANAAIYSL